MINYQFLHQSTLFYETHKFQRIESPWTVTKAVSEITKPIEFADLEIKDKDKVLVASGEQSFLYLYLKNFLPKGRFQTITPCFRNEPFDQTHTKYFMKNELIITDSVSHKTLIDTVSICKSFFESIHQNHIEYPVEIIQTSDTSFDLNLNGIEIGSYGIRTCEFLKWIYATGIAEPRFSQIINNLK
jgi:hypothetical protein